MDTNVGIMVSVTPCFPLVLTTVALLWLVSVVYPCVVVLALLKELCIPLVESIVVIVTVFYF